MRTKGMWVSPTEFVQFGESSKSLSDQIATRGRSIDFHALGMYLPNPDPVLKARGKDIKVYQELRADAHVGGCIRRRKAAVKALEWGLDREKAKSRVAKNIEASGDRSPYEPSFGYTLRKKSNPVVDTRTEDGKIELIRNTDIFRPFLLGADAGYLISDTNA